MTYQPVVVKTHSLLLAYAVQVKFVGRFDTWNNTHGPFTGKVSALQRLAPGTKAVTVKDMERFVETMHIFAIHHYLTVRKGLFVVTRHMHAGTAAVASQPWQGHAGGSMHRRTDACIPYCVSPFAEGT